MDCIVFKKLLIRIHASELLLWKPTKSISSEDTPAALIAFVYFCVSFDTNFLALATKSNFN